MEEDQERENRIIMEVIVDAHDAEERIMGWYYYLNDEMQFPFSACCIQNLGRSPLREGDQVMVVEMTSVDECLHDMLVDVEWKGRRFGVPLAQLKPLNIDKHTQEVVDDWHYWAARGYEF